MKNGWDEKLWEKRKQYKKSQEKGESHEHDDGRVCCTSGHPFWLFHVDSLRIRKWTPAKYLSGLLAWSSFDITQIRFDCNPFPLARSSTDVYTVRHSPKIHVYTLEKKCKLNLKYINYSKWKLRPELLTKSIRFCLKNWLKNVNFFTVHIFFRVWFFNDFFKDSLVWPFFPRV